MKQIWALLIPAMTSRSVAPHPSVTTSMATVGSGAGAAVTPPQTVTAGLQTRTQLKGWFWAWQTPSFGIQQAHHYLATTLRPGQHTQLILLTLGSVVRPPCEFGAFETRGYFRALDQPSR